MVLRAWRNGDRLLSFASSSGPTNQAASYCLSTSGLSDAAAQRPQCAESAYISSRPFRVNAGAVHAYVASSGGRTAYLSELAAGATALVTDAAGASREVPIGRCKVCGFSLAFCEARSNPALCDCTLPPLYGSKPCKHAAHVLSVATRKLING